MKAIIIWKVIVVWIGIVFASFGDWYRVFLMSVRWKDVVDANNS